MLRIALFVVAILFSLATLFSQVSQSADSARFALANVAMASLRSQPSHSSELETQVTHGTPLMILGKQGEWMNVCTPDGYKAYIPASLIVEMTDSAFAAWCSSQRAIVTELQRLTLLADTIYLLSAHPVSDILPGAVLQIVDSSCHQGGFTVVRLPDSRTGYLPTAALTPIEQWARQEKSEKRIIDAAEHFLGISYLWGGTTLAAVDCSGFTQLIYFLNGAMLLPRNASMQAQCGVEVELDSLKPGDLLFFGPEITDPGRPDKITHVGVYAGESTYIHASGMVHRSSFDSSHPLYNGRKVITARRILAAPSTPGVVPVLDHPWFGLN